MNIMNIMNNHLNYFLVIFVHMIVTIYIYVYIGGELGEGHRTADLQLVVLIKLASCRKGPKTNFLLGTINYGLLDFD